VVRSAESGYRTVLAVKLGKEIYKRKCFDLIDADCVAWPN
jgi:hypothetical protein